MNKFNLCECNCKNQVKSKTAQFLPGHNNRNRKRSEYEKKKISETMKRIMTDEMRKIRSENSKGRKHTEKAKQKMAKAAKKREKIKKEQGFSVSQETRKKISIASKGKFLTEKHRQKIGIGNKGKIRSLKLKKEISNSLKQFYSKNISAWKGRKHTEKAKQKMREANLNRFDGPNHPQWQGGISNFPYCFSWTEISKAIRERDNNECQNPNCQNSTTNDLVSHHINYDKENCDGINLIALCRSCNAKANFNRKYYQNKYINIMIKKGIIKTKTQIERIKQNAKKKQSWTDNQKENQAHHKR